MTSAIFDLDQIIANDLQKALPSGSGCSMTLDQLPLGQQASIIGIDWPRLPVEEAKRLLALGFDAGAKVTISHRGIFGGRDPIAVRIGRMTVALRRTHASAMAVRAC